MRRYVRERDPPPSRRASTSTSSSPEHDIASPSWSEPHTYDGSHLPCDGGSHHLSEARVATKAGRRTSLRPGPVTRATMQSSRSPAGHCCTRGFARATCSWRAKGRADRGGQVRYDLLSHALRRLAGGRARRGAHLLRACALSPYPPPFSARTSARSMLGG
jgi:hypothetical protein